MIRFIHEQVKCKKCGFINLKRFLIYYDAQAYPEHTEDLLNYDFYLSCMVCDWKEKYDREVQVITPKGKFIVRTGWPKERIRQLFIEHGVINDNSEEKEQ